MHLGSQFGAGRASANDRDVKLAGTYRAFLGLSANTRIHQTAIEACRLGRGFQWHGVLGDPGCAEVVRHTARRDDDVVVGDFSVLGAHRSLLDVDRQGLGPKETEAGFRERHAQRIRDGVGRQLAGRDLVEQRCEEREVGAVDQRDLRLAGPQALLEMTDEVQTAEAATDYDDALRHVPFPTVACTRSSSWR